MLLSFLADRVKFCSKIILIFSSLIGVTVEAHEFSLIPRIYLIVRVYISIDAPPEKIWPYLKDYRFWLDDIILEERISGTAGTAGEVIRVTKSDATSRKNITFLKKTTKQIENQWLVLRLYSEQGNQFVGFNSIL